MDERTAPYDRVHAAYVAERGESVERLVAKFFPMTFVAGGRVLEPRTKAYLAMEGNAQMSNYLTGYSSTFPTTGIQPTMTTAEKVIRTEIDRREKELASLRQALAALSGGSKTGKDRAATGKRRPKTAAEKKLLSAKMKAAWKRRKAAEKSAAK